MLWKDIWWSGLMMITLSKSNASLMKIFFKAFGTQVCEGLVWDPPTPGLGGPPIWQTPVWRWPHWSGYPWCQTFSPKSLSHAFVAKSKDFHFFLSYWLCQDWSKNAAWLAYGRVKKNNQSCEYNKSQTWINLLPENFIFNDWTLCSNSNRTLMRKYLAWFTNISVV